MLDREAFSSSSCLSHYVTSRNRVSKDDTYLLYYTLVSKYIDCRVTISSESYAKQKKFQYIKEILNDDGIVKVNRNEDIHNSC